MVSLSGLPPGTSPQVSMFTFITSDQTTMLRSTTKVRNGLEPDKSMTFEFRGYPRSDGRTGIRNLVVVAYLVECAHHVSREIQYPFREKGVHLIGFPGCYPNECSHRIME